MTVAPWPKGLLTALVTPLKDDRLNTLALEKLVERQISAGVSGLVIGGGTGEFGALTSDERRLLAREAIRLVAERVPVVVQTGALATADAISLSRDAEASGAKAVMVASPFGEPINWRERWRFYEQLDASISLPIMIYNTLPAGVLTLEQLQQLAELPNVSAVKNSSPDPELMGDLLEWSATEDFCVYVGFDSLLYDALNAGASGAVLGAASFMPGPLSHMVGHLLRNGSTAESLALWRHLRPFLRFLERSPNYVALCKAACKLDGIDVGDVRAPYLMPTPTETAELARRLEDLRKASEEAPIPGPTYQQVAGGQHVAVQDHTLAKESR